MAEAAIMVHVGQGRKEVCGICKSEVDFQLFKCIDCEIYICNVCSDNHKRIPVTKHHRITIGVERETKKMTETSRICMSHSNEQIQFYCKACNMLICIECITSAHSNHKIIKLQTFAEEKRENLRSELEKVKILISEKMEEHEWNNDDNKNDIITNIDARKLKLISGIDKMHHKLVEESENIHKSNETKLIKIKSKLRQDLRKLELNVNTGSDIEIIVAEHEISQRLDKLESSSNRDPELYLPFFVPGESDDITVQTLYGSIHVRESPSKGLYSKEVVPDTGASPTSQDTGVGFHSCGPSSDNMKVNPRDDSVYGPPDADVEVLSKFKCKSERIASICPLTDNNSIIHYYRLCDNDIVSYQGQVQKTLKLDFVICDIIMTSQGDIMATDNNKPIIHKLTQDGTNISSVGTGRLRPAGLCKCKDGNILVSMVDKWTYDVNESSRRLVMRMSMKGDTVQTYEYDDGRRLFTRPRRVSENINMDVCVIDRQSTQNGRLVLLDRSGKVKRIYEGRKLKLQFDPFDVKCDKVGNIIVNDVNNKTIHMLSINGEFIKYLLTEDILVDYPMSLAIDNRGILLVGGHEGNVYTIRYN